MVALFRFIYNLPRLWRKATGRQTAKETMQEYIKELERRGML